jgi:hypothetical protein
VRNAVSESVHTQVCEELEMLEMAGAEFDLEQVRRGELTPVFFGSANEQLRRATAARWIFRVIVAADSACVHAAGNRAG